MRFLDTDVMLDLLNGYKPAVDWLAGLDKDEEAPVLPGYVAMELLNWQGLKTEKDLEKIFEVLAEFVICWPSPDVCNEALGDVYQNCLTHKLMPFDALIGECALEYGATLCTFNPNYAAIDGLETEQPYKRG